MKKTNNKGFSLVELIVVVAIMAVLVGVLAPAYLRYVEKSRIQKDDSAVAEVVEAVKIAAAEEKCYDILANATAAVEIGELTNAGWTGDSDDVLNEEVSATVADFAFSSKAWKGTSAPAISVELVGTDVVVTVTGAPTESSFKSAS